MAGAVELWRAAVPPKVKLFFWLALHGRLWTAERRMRHGLQPSATCAMCDQSEETIDHLLCSCVYAREVWARILRTLDSRLAPAHPDSQLLDWWMSGRASLPGALRRSFDSLCLLVSWGLWKEKNRRTFDRRSSSPRDLALCIRDEGEEWVGAGFSSLAAFFATVATANVM